MTLTWHKSFDVSAAYLGTAARARQVIVSVAHVLCMGLQLLDWHPNPSKRALLCRDTPIAHAGRLRHTLGSAKVTVRATPGQMPAYWSWRSLPPLLGEVLHEQLFGGCQLIHLGIHFRLCCRCCVLSQLLVWVFLSAAVTVAALDQPLA